MGSVEPGRPKDLEVGDCPAASVPLDLRLVDSEDADMSLPPEEQVSVCMHPSE